MWRMAFVFHCILIDAVTYPPTSLVPSQGQPPRCNGFLLSIILGTIILLVHVGGMVSPSYFSPCYQNTLNVWSNIGARDWIGIQMTGIISRMLWYLKTKISFSLPWHWVKGSVFHGFIDQDLSDKYFKIIWAFVKGETNRFHFSPVLTKVGKPVWTRIWSSKGILLLRSMTCCRV